MCNARDLFGGRLTSDFVVERVGHSNLPELTELDVSNCAIRVVDLGPNCCQTFQNLVTLNLEHNNLTNFSGLIFLPHLKVVLETP